MISPLDRLPAPGLSLPDVPIRAAATVYTDVFRGLPLLLVLYLLGFGVPSLRIS